MTQPRAWIRQPSGLHLDLLDPSPQGWSDQDLAIGLSRTFRWGGHSVWPMPLSVAQHSLTVLALAAQAAPYPLTRAEEIRELVHDADEALIGGFDPVSPIKPFLGEAFRELCTRLQQTVFNRYNLTPWNPEERVWHKQADILAAASEAVHVAGWSTEEIKTVLKIEQSPLHHDPLAELYDCKAWEPWSPELAAERFYEQLTGQGAISFFVPKRRAM